MLYRHFRGNLYEVLIEGARFVEDASPTETSYTVYKGQDGVVWVRKSADFHGTVKDDHGKRVKRFKKVKNGST